MSDKEFNLLDERWIRVIDRNCNIVEVSLLEVFRDAHLYQDLCGELPTQDFAVMRVLLAVLHTVFARYDVNGNISRLNDPDDALDRWEELWTKKKFPEEVITAYLESQRENFYLFHPERPFFQVASMKKFGKIKNGEFDARKLNGAVSKSAHKERLFAMVSGSENYCLSREQSARWLIYLNAFDDNALKAGAGIGWLGELGLVAVAGNNLFETLMLNFIIYNIYDNEIWNNETPIWENRKETLDKRQIIFPDNLAELYTLQSRRILLKHADDHILGYKILGGDYFDRESAIFEPMTLWKYIDKNDSYVPKTHDLTKFFWQEFSSVIIGSEHNKCPGIISWLSILNETNIIDKKYSISLKIAGIKYSGSQRSSVENIGADSIQMHAALISSMSHAWQNMIINCVDFCDNVAKKVWNFARDVNVAEGGDFVLKEEKCSAKVYANKYKSEFYNRVDAPFRKWLCMIEPETDDADQKEREWRGECIAMASDLGEEIVKQSDPVAILGGVREGCCVAKAMNQFKHELHLLKDA